MSGIQRPLSSEYKSSSLVLTKVPDGIILIETLKRICSRRIHILTYLEQLSSSHEEHSELWFTSATEHLKNNFPEIHKVCTDKGNSLRVLIYRRHDRIARFVLLHSLFCNKEYIDVDWILRNEVRLFRIYFLHLPICEQIQFIEENKLAKRLVADELYEVSWIKVLSLVKEKAIELVQGKAYIKPCHFNILACTYQKENLSLLLLRIKRGFSTVKLDFRFHDLVLDLRKKLDICINKSQFGDWLYNIETHGLNLTNLDDLSLYFPPCMERMYHHIETKHHLRFNGRLQFIPFMKDIGFSVHETLQYFKYHFRQIMSDKQYKSEKYEYFIKHQYGLEGRRLQYHTMNCLNIKDKSVEALSDCHGCPLLSATNIENTLELPSFNDMKYEDKQHIQSLVGQTSHNRICAKILSIKLSKNENDLKAINNPIEYYAMFRDKIQNPFEDFDFT